MEGGILGLHGGTHSISGNRPVPVSPKGSRRVVATTKVVQRAALRSRTEFGWVLKNMHEEKRLKRNRTEARNGMTSTSEVISWSSNSGAAKAQADSAVHL